MGECEIAYDQKVRRCAQRDTGMELACTAYGLTQDFSLLYCQAIGVRGAEYRGVGAEKLWRYEQRFLVQESIPILQQFGQMWYS
ncbi:hypothetical protein BCD67_10205 [Oscillatoriales cyanobacterium USR001]|nr:hypothetical protein BCD67_10205 [Oscillatoriales cyanobacterium USR001]